MSSSKPLKKRATALSPGEHAIINFFVQLAGDFHIPKSVATIYGLLYCAPEPMSFEEIRLKLGMSAGSASQGLRFLMSIGAVQKEYREGDRRDYWRAETELREVAAGLLREKVEPHMRQAPARLDKVREAVEKSTATDRDYLESRLRKLENWEKTARRLVPMILLLISDKNKPKN